MCKSCSSVGYCLELPTGDFEKIDLLNCESGQTCLKATGSCTALPNPDCPIPDTEYTFRCFQVGIFPDALSCFEYHICTNEIGTNQVNPVSRQLKCEAGFYFDPLTTLCRLRSVNGLCPTPIKECSALGETGVHPLNPALYYVCLTSPVKLYPQIIACPNALIYNTTTNSCVNRREPPTAAGSDGKCTARGYFYDPADCHNYFECGSVGGTPVARKCATKTYFNTTTSLCAEFKCTDFQ